MSSIFCRSFSEDLFTQALIVLNKIGIDAKFVKKFEELNKKLNVSCFISYVLALPHTVSTGYFSITVM